MQKFLTLKDVEEVTTLRRSKIYQMIKDKSFPPQIKITANRSAWFESEILDWMESLRVALPTDGDSQ